MAALLWAVIHRTASDSGTGEAGRPVTGFRAEEMEVWVGIRCCPAWPRPYLRSRELILKSRNLSPECGAFSCAVFMDMRPLAFLEHGTL